jgi:hypothetical protein
MELARELAVPSKLLIRNSPYFGRFLGAFEVSLGGGLARSEDQDVCSSSAGTRILRVLEGYLGVSGVEGLVCCP